MKAHSYENAGSAGILPVVFTAFSWFGVATLAMGVGIRLDLGVHRDDGTVGLGATSPEDFQVKAGIQRN